MSNQMTVGVFGNSRGGTTAVMGVVQLLGVHSYSVRLSNDDDYIRKDGAPWHLIERRNQEHDIWGFKNPAMLTEAATIQHLLRKPKFIFVSRDPIASLSHDTHLFNIRRLEDANERNRNFFETLPKIEVPFITFSYERFARDPERYVRHIANFLDLPFQQRAVEFVSNRRGYMKVADFLRAYEEEKKLNI